MMSAIMMTIIMVVYGGDEDDSGDSNDGHVREESDNRDLRTHESCMRNPCHYLHAYQ